MKIRNSLTYFLNEVYTKCQEVGLTPQQVFDYISDILKFSSEVTISQIPIIYEKNNSGKARVRKYYSEII